MKQQSSLKDRRIGFAGPRRRMLFGVMMCLFGGVMGVPGRLAAGPTPEIEFRVLLIIKKKTDSWSPLFLPVRAEMSDAEIKAAKRCFEIETPDMVRDITRGKVRFIPTVHISEEPLRLWNPDRRDSAEISKEEMFDEFSRIAKPGEFDSVGYYFLPRDDRTGYAIPRAGYGVGWFEQARSAGAFAVHAAEMHPRDEIFLHEWMHGLEQFYHGKPGVRLPKGWLHGSGNYDGYQERPYRPGDTFRGWMHWYKDFLNREIRESDGSSGLGSPAWRHGPMRYQQPPAPLQSQVPHASGKYPEWIYRLMTGDTNSVTLGPDILVAPQTDPGGDMAPWEVRRWASSPENRVERMAMGSDSVIRILSNRPDDVQLVRRLGLKPFSNYILSAEVRTNQVRVSQAGGRYAASIAAGTSRSKAIQGTTEWQLVSLCFTTGEKGATSEIRLSLGGIGSLAEGEVMFRNVRLRQIPYPSAD